MQQTLKQTKYDLHLNRTHLSIGCENKGGSSNLFFFECETSWISPT